MSSEGNSVLVVSSKRNSHRASQIIQELLRWTTLVDAELSSYPVLQIATKYFSAQVTLQPQTYSAIADGASPSGDGLISVATLNGDTPDTFPWQLASASSFLFRALVLFVSGSDNSHNREKALESWSKAAVAHGFELIARSELFEPPVQNAERRGILDSVDVSGSSRLLQLLHNVLWPKTSRSGVKPSPTPITTHNRMLIVGDNEDYLSLVLQQAGFVVSSRGEEPFSAQLSALHKGGGSSSGQAKATSLSSWCLSNKYYAANILVSYFHSALFVPQMSDVVSNYLKDEEARFGPIQALMIFVASPHVLTSMERSAILSQLSLVSSVALRDCSVEAKVFCHRQEAWALSEFDKTWFAGNGFEVVETAHHRPPRNSPQCDEDGPIGAFRLREVLSCVEWRHRTPVTDTDKAMLERQLGAPNRLFVCFLCGGTDKNLILTHPALSPYVAALEGNTTALHIATKYYDCAVDVIFLNAFDSRRMIEAQLSHSCRNDPSRRVDSDGFIFVIPAWATTDDLLDESMKRYCELAELILQLSDTAALTESTGLRLLWCPGVDENAQEDKCIRVEQCFSELNRVEVLYSETAPASSRLYESLVSVEWADRREKAAPQSRMAQQLTPTEEQHVVPTVHAAEKGDDEDSGAVIGCEPPPYILVDPETQQAYVCNALLESRSGSTDDSVAEELMRLMQLVKTQGHRLRRDERLRQAKILAEKLGELMDSGDKNDGDDDAKPLAAS